MSDITELILAAPIILFSLVLHEFAHGMTSARLGDPTPRRQGRLTLNPLAHLDPIGTLMIIFTMIRGVGFGWAKPVQIDPGYYKNPRKGSLLVSLAGPAANIFLACFFGLLLRFFYTVSTPNFMGDTRLTVLILRFLSIGVLLNLSLAFFNLLPVPPLDGSKILRFFLRGKVLEYYVRLEQYGFFLLLGILLLLHRELGILLYTFVRFFFRLITGI